MKKDTNINAHKRERLRDLNNEGCINVIAAVVAETAREWRECRQMIALNADPERDKKHMKHIEAFIRSEYFYDLTNLNGEDILRKLEAEFIDNRGDINKDGRYVENDKD